MSCSTRLHPPRFPSVFALAGVGALSLLSGCGTTNTSNMPTPPTTQATPPPPSVVSQGNGFPLEAEFAAGIYFSTDRAGTLGATVDYTFADNLIVVFIARGRCTEELFISDQCDLPVTSFDGPKPRRLTLSGAAPGTYTLIVGNGGPGDESISYQIVLTPTVAGTPVRSESASRSAAASWTAPLRLRR